VLKGITWRKPAGRATMSIYIGATIGLLNCWPRPKKTSADSELACIVSGVSLSVGTAERLQQKPETEP
jgi:hypothetical protein